MISDMPKETWVFNDTDTLPTDGTKNGQSAYNMDTQQAFMYDKEEGVWKEQ